MNTVFIPLLFALCTGADLVPPQSHVSQPVLVVLIGGFVSDPSPAQVNGTAGRGGNSGLYRLRGDLLRYDGISAEYFNWNGTRTGKITAPDPPMAAGIAAFIRERHATHPQERLIIVGNSWGGHTAREVCELLAEAPAVPIELMIFLDPSSLARVKHGQRPGGLPPNVERAVNYFTHHLLSWRHWSGEPRVENVDLGDPENGFCKSGEPPYDAVFDHRGHVCAEWDERIHWDIRHRIRQVRDAGHADSGLLQQVSIDVQKDSVDAEPAPGNERATVISD